MTSLDNVAFKAIISPRDSRLRDRAIYKKCKGGEIPEVPKVGEVFQFSGRTSYVAVWRIMPLLENWREYGIPPIVGASER